MSEPEPDFETLSDAAASVRRLITHLRKTKAPASLLAEVETSVRALTEKLAPYDHEGLFGQHRLILSETLEDHAQQTDDPSRYFPYSPIIGPLNPIAPNVDCELVGRELQALHTFEAQYNGPPGSTHGGVIALVFDELLGTLGAMLGIGGFTGTLEVVYRSLTPLHQPIRMRSWVDGEEGSKVFIKGTMHTTDEGAEERLCAEARGIFVRPKIPLLRNQRAGGASTE